MTVFDVSVNGQKVCRAGVGRDGVLNAIVSWVRLAGPAASHARRLKAPLEETQLHIGGLAGNTHRHWPNRDLTPGDRVVIEVGKSQTFDPPSAIVARDPGADERRQREYYEQLKRQFEPAARPARRGRGARNEETTRFLNVDLDVWSASPLDSLAEAFGDSVLVHRVGKEGRRHGAHMMLAGSGMRGQTAEKIVQRWIAVIAKLPSSARRTWRRASVRDLNIGIQGGSRPYSNETRLSRQ